MGCGYWFSGKPIRAVLWNLPKLHFTGESEYSYLDLGCLECFGSFLGAVVALQSKGGCIYLYMVKYLQFEQWEPVAVWAS